MRQDVSSIVRLLAGLGAALCALGGVGLMLAWEALGSPLLAVVGCIGSFAAAVVLMRVAGRGIRPGRSEGRMAVFGIIAFAIVVGMGVSAFGHSFDKAYLAAMKGELRNVIAAEDSAFARDSAYTSAVVDLAAWYSPSGGVAITLTATEKGVQAVATHASLPGTTCVAYIGTDRLAPAAEERVPACAP